ncbi:MAG TPA: hypothetical protein VJ142_02195 [Candidatus Nanoarchaeia archaeon]|nr:hypothetical protein [Candidatus Nanoarchaeia archaeon]
MKRGWNKIGQFYLVSAIIVAAIVISVIVVTNYSKKQDYSDLNSLRDELNIESAKVLDYGINNQLSQAAMNQLLQDFTQKYIDTESRDKNLYFVFGNQDNITLKGYQNTAHTVSLDSANIASSSGEFLGIVNPTGSSTTLQIDENAYIFTLKNGENFFFVISREIGGEEHVITG